MEAGIVQRIFRDHFETYRTEHGVSERERWAACEFGGHNTHYCNRPVRNWYYVPRLLTGHSRSEQQPQLFEKKAVTMGS